MVQQADLLRDATASGDKRKEKSPNALRTISEAADVLGVPQHVLRFWETKFPQITPLKRNGGRRFYRPEDITVLQQIKFLLYQQGYTIKGARKAIEDFAKGTGSMPQFDAQSTPAKGWYQTVPAANSNDNAKTPSSESSPKEHVDAMRDELVRMRESLKKLLPEQQ